MKLHSVPRCAGVVWLLASATAQSFVVVPSNFDTREAVNKGVIAGLEQRFRHQYLISGQALLAMQGKSIQAVWFRRDAYDGLAMPAVSTVLRVQASHARMPSAAPSSTLASNQGLDATPVFNGAVNLQPAPPVGNGPAPWAAPFALRLPFSPAFVYRGGDLCLEVDGDPPNPTPIATWWVDYDREADVGIVVPYGRPCGAPAVVYAQTQDAWGANLIPGGTFCLWSVGQPNTPAILLLGTQAASTSLDSIGATGCTLLVQPQAQIPAGTYWRPDPLGRYSLHTLTVPIDIPSNPTLLNVRFFAQFANLESGSSTSNAAGVTLTNALDLTTGARMPLGTISTVITGAVPLGTPFPATGRVDVSRGPVLRFEYDVSSASAGEGPLPSK